MMTMETIASSTTKLRYLTIPYFLTFQLQTVDDSDVHSFERHLHISREFLFFFYVAHM
jgi:hypothetical protein